MLSLVFLSSLAICQSSPRIASILRQDASCKQQLHSCIDNSAKSCKEHCSALLSDKKVRSGIGSSIDEWFDCYTDCAIQSGIDCYVSMTECIRESNTSQPHPTPEEPGTEPEYPFESSQQHNQNQRRMNPQPQQQGQQQGQQQQQQYPQNSQSSPPPHQMFRARFNSPQDNSLCCDLSCCDLSCCCDNNFCSLNGNIPLEDIEEGDSLWFGFPGYYGGGFGFGGFRGGYGYGGGFGYPGFGYGGFGYPGFGGYGYGGGYRYGGYGYGGGWW
ncbi:hypothetical protein BLNAU_22250 [Blattamonas nauphoetae]|uniref:Uncharacterized protein n=2 Tax=Blattamonas nauphoetae TaxID=2049346 RepID=A0ABQ9WWP1_9EUKA|nr:hypothetical protein BLNAU_22250 [Blattamonas nauphoetae]